MTLRPMPNFRLARRMDKIEVSGIRRIFDLVQGMKDAVDLSLGQPHFEVPDEVKGAAIRAIEGGFNRYTQTQGIPELNAALRKKIVASTGRDPEGVIVTSGVAGGLFMALMVLVEPADEVLIADPYFVLYRHLVNLCGGTPVLVDTFPDFRLTVERLERAVTPKTRILLVNNPVNPTGVAYSAEEVRAIADFARRRDLVLISDEIYEAFSYDFPHEPMARHNESTITLGGFSKTYAMPGWRLGWAAGPKAVIEAMITFQQFSFVCAPSPAQKAGLVALDTDMSARIGEYRRKRDMLYDGLKDRYDMVRPQGAFYAFPKVPWGDDDAFVRTAIENKVLIVPGSACSTRKTHFRLSFAASDATLARGIEILQKLARK